MVVVLPAPLGPMKPKQSPSWISRLRLDSATSVPYRLVRLTVLMTAAMRSRGSFADLGLRRAQCFGCALQKASPFFPMPFRRYCDWLPFSMALLMVLLYSLMSWFASFLGDAGDGAGVAEGPVVGA